MGKQNIKEKRGIMKRFISILLAVSMIFVMLSAQGFVSYGSTTNEIVIDNCKEIKVNEETSFMVLFDNTYTYKFVPEVTGVYTFSFERDSWVFYMVSSLYDDQLEKIVSKENEKDSFEATLTAGNAYYLEIYTNSGDVMCGASVTVELKEEIVEVTLPPTDVPVETVTPGATILPTPDCVYPTDTPTSEVTITPTPTCIYPTDTPEPLKTPTPEPTETIKPTEEIVETVCPWAPTGDVNIDDIINAEDALLVLKHAAKMVTLTGQSLEAADTNDDGNIDAKDALEILKYAAKIE